jgi:hypothetical protein
MNRGWTKIARGELDIPDRTKFESIKVLNTALMERLGEANARLIKAEETRRLVEDGDLLQRFEEADAQRLKAQEELEKVKVQLHSAQEELNRLNKLYGGSPDEQVKIITDQEGKIAKMKGLLDTALKLLMRKHPDVPPRINTNLIHEPSWVDRIEAAIE